MTDPQPGRLGASFPSRAAPAPYASSAPSSLADILERVLDKGIVIAGDIRINLLDIELLTIKLRILVASVDKAKEMGIDWWEHDPSLSSRHAGSPLEAENRRLRAELEALRRDQITGRTASVTSSSGSSDVTHEREPEAEPEPEPEPEPEAGRRARPVRRTTNRRPRGEQR
ncbi:gas vesicle protein [Streptomyces sp. NPDC012769]|uniref:gas vesicle protein n=1 Tax=Streptomyces sp. NPDC012769 TaxID=3364848 RepID=UPI0036A6D24F